MRFGGGSRRSGRDEERAGAPDRRGDDGGAPPPPQLDGYVDLEVIGHGASATVYRARQQAYDRRVAVKVLHVDVSDRRAQKRFQRERELNGRLSDHPNVVTVLDSGFVHGRHPFLVMELFERGSLADQLQTNGPFDVETALHIGVRIAGALETAHQLGVLHRDVKPQNVLLSRFAEPALADFGIATLLEREHSLTAALTPVHAAPEVLEGGEPTAATDVYALASTVFTLLSGAPPFVGPPGEGLLAQLLRITTSDLPALGRADVPVALVDVLRRAMAKRPEERTPTAAAFGEALREVQVAIGLPASPLPVELVASAPPRAAVFEPAPPRAVVEPAVVEPAVVEERDADERDAAEPARPAPAVVAFAGVARPAATGATSPVARGTTLGAAPATSAHAATHALRAPTWPPPPTTETPTVSPVATVADRLSPRRNASWVGEAVGAPTIDVGGGLDAPTVTSHVVHPAVERPVPARRRRWLVPTLSLAAVGVGAAAAAVIVPRAFDRRDAAATPAATTTVAATTTALAATTTAPDLKALAPAGVAVSVDGGSVLVTWTDRSGGRAPHVVYVFPTERNVAPTPAGPGVTSLVVKGLDPAAPACIVVSAVVSLGRDAASPAVRADAAPICVNGAVAAG